MKKHLILCGLFTISAIAMASGELRSEEKLGSVIAIKRTFQVNAGDCDKVKIESESHVSCGVKVMKEKAVGDIATDTFPKADYSPAVDENGVSAALIVTDIGYNIFASGGSSKDSKVNRQNREAAIQRLIRENREVSVIVHVIN